MAAVESSKEPLPIETAPERKEQGPYCPKRIEVTALVINGADPRTDIPWAQRIADGHVTMAIRSRATSYRGPLLIVQGTYGVCTVDLTACRPVGTNDSGVACPRQEAVAGKRGSQWVYVFANPKRPEVALEVGHLPAEVCTVMVDAIGIRKLLA